MASLSIAETKTLKWEGGYCNVVGDKGGETIFGIARNSHPTNPLWKIVDSYKEQLKPFNKTKYKELESKCLGNIEFKNHMDSLYRKLYWDKIFGDRIESQLIANALYDFAVNSGVSRAVKEIQKCINTIIPSKNLTCDGVMGEKTLLAINSEDEKLLGRRFYEARVAFFHTISKNGQNAKFLKGWLKRAEDFGV